MLKILRKIGKYILWFIAGVISLVLLVFVAFYVPPVQDAIVSKVLETINKKGSEMRIDVGKLRISFPLDLYGKDIDVVLPGDIEAKVGEIDAKVNPVYLLKGDIHISDIEILKTGFRLGSPDSTLHLNAEVDTFTVNDVNVGLISHKINLDKGLIGGSDIKLFIAEDEKEKEDTVMAAATESFDIEANQITLKNLNYLMSINPGIDTLQASITDAVLNTANVDLNTQNIYGKSFDVEGLSAKYIYSVVDVEKEEVKEEKQPADSIDVKPWDVRIDNINLTGKDAVYALKDAKPAKGFDLDYIEVSDIEIRVDSFSNSGADIRVPLKELSVKERCGLTLNASGLFEIENSEMEARDFEIFLPGSRMDFNATMGLQSPQRPTPADCPLSVDLSAEISMKDIETAMPSLASVLTAIPGGIPLRMSVIADGSMASINNLDANVSLPRLLSLSAKGYVHGLDKTGLNYMDAKIRLTGDLQNTKMIKPSVVESKLGKGIELNPLTVKGDVSLHNGQGVADVVIRSMGGEVALDGSLNFRNNAFNATVDIDKLPLQDFMPHLGISDVSMNISAEGNSTDILSDKTEIKLDADLNSLVFKDVTYHDIELRSRINQGTAKVELSSYMPEAYFTINADGNLNGEIYNWRFNGDIENLDLKAIDFSKESSHGAIEFVGMVNLNVDSMFVNATMNFPRIFWEADGRSVRTSDFRMDFNGNRFTDFSLRNQDLSFIIDSPLPLDSIIRKLPEITEATDTCVKSMNLDIPLLQKSLPEFDLNFIAGRNNIIASWMKQRGETFDSLKLNLHNDSIISMNAMLSLYSSPKSVADTLSATIRQINDSLRYNFRLKNGPDVPGDWSNVRLWGRIGGNELTARFRQKNYYEETGFDIGLDAVFADSVINVHFLPQHPVIGYKKWNLNTDNFIKVNLKEKHLDADLELSNPKSALRLYTDHIEGNSNQEEINLTLSNIQIADWISLNPFATPLKGLLSGKISLSHEPGKIYGDGNVSLNDFYYGKQKVGSFKLGLDVSTTPGGVVRAEASLDVDSLKVLTVSGNLNDSTAINPFMLDFNIDRLPLPIANPFLSDAGLELSGNLNGRMKITGTPERPVFNGFIDFNSAGVKVKMLGTTFKLSEKAIPVDTGLISFSDYDIMAVNENPIVLNGTVDMKDVINPVIDLSLKATDIQLVGTDRARGGAEVFGKAFVDLNASAKGDMRFLKVDAAATVLPSTNVTYVLVGGTQNALTSRSNSDLVKFVNFADTAMVEAADSIKLTGMLMSLNANLTIDRGAQLNVDLSADGKNKVSIEPAGSLDYSMDIMGSQHLTGRLNINEGFARYTPPLMSEKIFNFKEGSYVEFNGDIMNPILNIHAVDHLRANVTQEGQNSRLIYFDILLDITGSLENMHVAFDLSTDDDITVENELASMSPSQRASQAMNLLLTNIYSGPGTTGDANLGANALYSFLSSTLNSWAANNIRGVDLSFGVNQYDTTVDGISSQTTSYSYRVSKSLFNDRFKIIIGGSYSTDANADENFSQNLINDISFEYILNKSGSMYITLFRHTGYESILEGEVTQTGVGFTYKKRLDSLKQMFHFFYPKHKDKKDDGEKTDGNKKLNAVAKIDEEEN